MSDERIVTLATGVGEALDRNGLLLVTAESCTGGWIAKAITDVPGSTGWFDCGFVTYSNAAKSELLGVDRGLIGVHGAVSREVVEAMAAGALARSSAGVAVAVSGIAGPGGGTAEKPPGTVWLAWTRSGGDCDSLLLRLTGGRDEVRRGAVIAALEGIIERAGQDIFRPHA